MFKIGNIYKHVNCLDICFRVDSVDEKDNGDVELIGLWLNQHYDMIPICEDQIIVEKDKIKKWKQLPLTKV